MMRALVTGGAGFIGSHLVEKLIRSGREVVVYDNLSTGALSNLRGVAADRRFRFVRGDILDVATLSAAMAGCGEVYHLAAAVGVQVIMRNPCAGMLTNTAGTHHVLELACANRCRAFYTSSREVYGRCSPDDVLEEARAGIMGSPTVTRWSYAISKLAGEYAAAALCAERGLRVTTGRLFNVVGPRQSAAYGMVLPAFVEQARDGRPLTVFGDGRQRRAFIDVEDVVKAIVSLSAEESAVGKVFNIGNSDDIAIEDLASAVIAAAGSRSKINHVAYEAAYGAGFEDISGGIAETSLIRRSIAFSPSVPLDQSIAKVIAERRGRRAYGVEERGDAA